MTAWLPLRNLTNPGAVESALALTILDMNYRRTNLRKKGTRMEEEEESTEADWHNLHECNNPSTFSCTEILNEDHSLFELQTFLFLFRYWASLYGALLTLPPSLI